MESRKCRGGKGEDQGPTLGSSLLCDKAWKCIEVLKAKLHALISKPGWKMWLDWRFVRVTTRKPPPPPRVNKTNTELLYVSKHEGHLSNVIKHVYVETLYIQYT
jgi:hypothetical protein